MAGRGKTVGVAVVLACGALACGAKVPLSDTGVGGTRGTGDSASASASATANPTGGLTTTGSDVTSGGVTSRGVSVGLADTGIDDTGFFPDWGLPPLACENPDHQCTNGIFNCDVEACGGLFSEFDEFGCLRNTCVGQADCAEGEICFRPQAYGGCSPTGAFCFEEEFGECFCESNQDCGGSYCVPADLPPPGLNCELIQDADSCTSASCNGLFDARYMQLVDNTCFCSLTQRCMFLPNGSEPAGGLIGYYRPGSSGVYFFDVFFDAPPTWVQCGFSPETDPPECFLCEGELDFCV